ncbi:MAG: citrate lyase acyl carrier protein [Clostridiales bacterium]|nr:citrate lyase acyl carrier protein [Clostridiales bacterium]
MEIKKPAMAGTLESSDCQVMVEAGNGQIDFSLESSVINQYGNKIRDVVYDTLERLGITDVRIAVIDKGALDCTIKARVEGAVYRSLNQTEHIPWGGAVR